MSGLIKKDLEKLSFILAKEKCEWNPSQKVIWLGHVLDTKEGIIKVTETRIQKLSKFLNIVINKISLGNLDIKPKFLASIVGQIQSMRGALGNIVRLHTRYSHLCLEARTSWYHSIRINSEVLDELFFWVKNVEKLNGQFC